MAHDLAYKKYEEQLSAWQNFTGAKPSDKPIRVALFGLGRIGLIHLDKIYSNPRVKLVYCVEPSSERCAYIKAKWNLDDVKFIVSTSGEIVFNDPTVDAVIIGTPTQTHFDILMGALRAGKNVLCEKPLASNYQGMEACYALAKEKGVVLLTAFNRRFDPTFNNIRQRIAAGEVGQIHVIKSCARDSPRPTIEYLATSGGIYHDCAVHDIDMLLWQTGEYPIRVSCTGLAFSDDIRAIDDHDSVAIMLTFPSGAIGMIDLDRNSPYGYDQRIEVFGPKGMLSGDNLRANGVVGENNNQSSQTPILYSFVSRYAVSYATELEHFINCVKGTEECTIKDYQALASYIVSEAAEKSARTGQTINLTWDENKFPTVGPTGNK
ncbi:myo-inositol 2-dehydrogenase-like [Panonychus citri]|uniref:myo-inositol 2-dehydrogenase-like n=1 Tax=Panonychus citri TaxID=50023 RepID=UPI002307C3D9|nr:myo-inositol 2-dehydrogenase-like [Panonychus citri]